MSNSSAIMHIAPHEAHQIAVHAGKGETSDMTALVQYLARRESTSTAAVLIASKDDFQQTAAHTAAKGGQSSKSTAGPALDIKVLSETDTPKGSIERLAELLSTKENKTTYFNMANRFSGDRPVHTALRHGFLEVFKALVSHGADPTVKNRFGDAVMDYPGDFEPEEVQKVVDEYKSRISKEAV